MNDTPKPVGSIAWVDLTVPDAKQIRDFYSSVVGWTSSSLSMGDYDDYCMQTPQDDQMVAGICHAQGTNANIPPQWLVYIPVADLQQSIKQCEALGGKVLDGPRSSGDTQFAVIQDPAGACVTLCQDSAKT